MLDRDDIGSAFFWLLGRFPESEDVINTLRERRDASVLRNEILGSQEFREFYMNSFLLMHRFAFIRVPKTGTTALDQALVRAGLARKEIDLGRGSEDSSVDLAKIFKSHQIVSGHFSLDNILPLLNGKKLIFVSSVRDPWRRVISLYRHAREDVTHPCYEDVKGRSLLQAIELDGLFCHWINNAQCRHITGRQNFTEAKIVLETQWFLVVDTESLDKALIAICGLAGVQPVSAGKLNESRGHSIDSILAQPDIEGAKLAVRWLAAEDRKLFDYIRGEGGIFLSESMRQLFAARGDHLLAESGIATPKHFAEIADTVPRIVGKR